MGKILFRKTSLIWVLILLIAAFLTVAESGAAPLPGGSLNPLTIPKYVDPLPIPGVMQPLSTAGGIDYYEIAVRQFKQQILPASLPTTTVWSYGTVNPAGVFNYPAFTIEATVNKPVRVKWMNQLVNDPVACAAAPGSSPACNYVSHILPVDRTLHWANPEQLGCMMNGMLMPMTDCRPDPSNGAILQQPYDGPVPAVVHLHGAHVNPDSDGYPEAWWLPAANNIPPGYATQGSNYTQIPGAPSEAGAALYQYRNDQRATTLWFHDHSLGMTRTNVYAGPAGFYLLRGFDANGNAILGADDMPSEQQVIGGLPGGAYEIPIVIQDRSFNSDGSLFYATSRSFFDGYAGPYVGDANTVSDISPIWNPEFFGNTMVVNGKTWPYLNVEPRKYRFRFLNGSDSRFLILKFDKKLTFTQIGTEGGFLPSPVILNQLLMGLAERADVVVDFSAFAPGSVITLLNVGPDEPFGGLPVPKNIAADPATTGQVMQFKVVLPLAAPDKSAVKKLPTITPISTVGATTRQVSLNELESNFVCVDKNMIYTTPLATNPLTCSKFSVPLAPLEAQLGTVDPVTGLGVPHPWMDAITEDPALNSTEIWEIHNFTVDAHPIHVHMVMFQVVDRTPLGAVIGGSKTRPPEVWETGFKDTVIAYPGEVTRIKAVFDIAGLFVWHCHILSHEDNEMMRPMCVGGGCNP